MSASGARAGMLLVQMQPPSAMEDEFHAWYDTEHVPEREAVDGFEVCTRWVCVDGWPRYMASYDLDALDVLQSDGYRAIGGPNLSVWSRRVLGRVVGYERLELERADAGADTPPEAPNGRAMLRFAASADRDTVMRGAEDLAATAPAARLRVFANALPDGQTTAMLDAPSLALIPAWGPSELSDCFGDAAAELIGLWRYRRYQRWI
jgi:hypothetical protein